MPLFSDYFSVLDEIPDKELGEQAHRHIRVVRAIADECVVTEAHGRLTICAGHIELKDRRVRLAGVYDEEHRRVLINTPQLQHLGTAIGAGVHEIAHHISKAEDGDMRHYSAMVKVAGIAAEAVGTGRLDYLLIGVVW